MLKVTARQYIELGQQIYDAQTSFAFVEVPEDDPEEQKKLEAEHNERLKDHLTAMRDVCREIGLAVSLALLNSRLTDIPKTRREFNLLVDAIWAELKGKLFLFVPPHRAKYYKLILPSTVTGAFPTAARELVLAGNGIAAEMYDAAVFHSMRAVELGLRAMASALGVTFSYPLELAEWGKIMGEIEPKIAEMQKLPRSTQRDEDLKFYAEAASQFRHFNNGWRVRTAHPRAIYEESQAIEVFDHALSFFRTLSSRLMEL